MLFFGRRLPKAAISIISPGAVGVSFLLSLGAVIQLAGLPTGCTRSRYSNGCLC